jgi:hypothetical protein
LNDSARSGVRGRLALGIGIAALAAAGAAAVYAASGEAPGGHRGRRLAVPEVAASETATQFSASVGVPASGSSDADGTGTPSTAAQASTELGPELTTSAPTAPGLDLVVVRVTTQPAGAHVRVVGAGEVCAKTPCSFEAMRGAPLSLQAVRGNRQTTTLIKPADTTELYLVLESAKVEKPAAPSESPHQGDGLKVPEMFRDAMK